MGRLAVAIVCVALTAAVSAQAGRGTLSGTVTVGWSGERPRGAPIQIRHADTGAALRTASDADGLRSASHSHLALRTVMSGLCPRAGRLQGR